LFLQEGCSCLLGVHSSVVYGTGSNSVVVRCTHGMNLADRAQSNLIFIIFHFHISLVT
jgi:hypothetical protein